AQVGARIARWVRSERARAQASVLERTARTLAFGFELLALIAPFCPARDTVPRGPEELARLALLQPVLEHIQRHFAEPLDRDTLAELACLSPAQFHLVFAATLGTSPMQHVQAVRLRHAQSLLIGTELNVAEIARRCGYADPFVFSKFFKRGCGQSPREYRRATRGMQG
ncbi:MAG: helix-turn-helix domain-containing protein, partial [Planctomycetota bacterium]